jgi:hypothetical protein
MLMATLASIQAPEYVASRVEHGETLPAVEVGGVHADGEGEGESVEEGLVRREEAVVRHVVKGLRGELVRELVGMMDVQEAGGGVSKQTA